MGLNYCITCMSLFLLLEFHEKIVKKVKIFVCVCDLQTDSVLGTVHKNLNTLSFWRN